MQVIRQRAAGGGSLRFTAVPELELGRAAVLAPALRESVLVEYQGGMGVTRPHELLFERAAVADLALVVRRVEGDAPAASVDPVVALDQLGERVPGGCVQRPTRVALLRGSSGAEEDFHGNNCSFPDAPVGL